MPQVRYGAKPPAQQVDHEIEATSSNISTQALTIVYETDPEIIAAILPPPLKPTAEPLVTVTFSQVAMDGRTSFGSGVFNLAAQHEGTTGNYCIFMPMGTEQATIGGRETFGEPKKIAQVTAVRDGEQILAGISRMGVNIADFRGRVVEELTPPAPAVSLEYYFKYFRNPDGSGLTDAQLVYCEYHREITSLFRVEGDFELHEAPLDPVADIVVRKIRSITWCTRKSRQTAHIQSRVDPDSLLPYVHQKYDDMELVAKTAVPA